LADLFGADRDMMDKWINPGRYVGGPELAAAGLAELLSFDDLSSISDLIIPSKNGQTLRPAKLKQRA
jgi:hypothetical protein